MANHNAGGNKKKATRPKVPAGMFVVSKPEIRKTYLKKWESHFKAKGIKTVIITDCKGKFFLCREGQEQKERYL
jgi:hypothetical protein